MVAVAVSRSARVGVALLGAALAFTVAAPVVYLAFPVSRTGLNILELLDRVDNSYRTANLVAASIWVALSLVTPVLLAALRWRPGGGRWRLLGPALMGFGMPAFLSFFVGQVVTFTTLGLPTDSNLAPSQQWIPLLNAIWIVGLAAMIGATCTFTIRRAR